MPCAWPVRFPFLISTFSRIGTLLTVQTQHLPIHGSANQLMTGDSYLESLNDDRHVYLSGERIKSITKHRAFKNAARSMAALYDELHNPCSTELMLTRSREGFLTHRYFTSSYSSEELFKARDALVHWARLTFGFMGRSPDYKAGFIATLGSFSEFYHPYEANARHWYTAPPKDFVFWGFQWGPMMIACGHGGACSER